MIVQDVLLPGPLVFSSEPLGRIELPPGGETCEEARAKTKRNCRMYDYLCIAERQGEERAFRSGDLVRSWAEAYPMLFDKNDLRNATRQCHLGHHYSEWLTAITLYEATSRRSLAGKYHLPRSHPDKFGIFSKRVPRPVLELLHGKSQGPDLFLYDPDRMDDWFFVEVKGLREPLTPPQQLIFPGLEGLVGHQVRCVRVRAASVSGIQRR